MDVSFGVVIPAYNEGTRLAAVLRGVKRHVPAHRIVVVDDGSMDDTAQAARAEGVILIEHAENRGKGVALRSGFERLLEEPAVEAIFTLDADGQHDPDEMPAFIERYRLRRVDILIGDRMAARTGMPPIRILTNLITSRVISWRTGCSIRDSQSGFRLISTALLRRLDFVTAHFDMESELLIKAGLGGAVIDSVPIRSIYRDERSKIHPLRDTVRFFVLVLRSLFW